MQKKEYILWMMVLVLFATLTACEQKKAQIDPTDLVDNRDGQRYSIETYGSQQWMAEHLAYNASGSKVNPDNPFSEYGRLYNYNQALTACPEGWHLPTDEEWQQLERHLGVELHTLGYTGYRGETIGGGLKSSTGWGTNNGTNIYFFNAYPAGSYVQVQESFEHLAQHAEFWTASESNLGMAWFRKLTKDYNSIFRGSTSKEDYRSCRCVKDE